MAGKPNRSLRSDLGRVRGLGSAKEGVQHWWAQRMTALALIPLSLWFVASIVFMIDVDHATAMWWLGSPVTLGLMSIFLVALIYHAVLGLQVVIEDYVHHEGWKLGLVVLMNLLVVAFAVAGLASIFFLAMGG